MPTGPTTTDRVRIAAAKLRITTDRKLGLETPGWVVELAKEGGGDEVDPVAIDPMQP